MSESAHSTTDSRRDTLIASMPWVFVLIWSTGFIVARYGMPYAPPITLLAWRFFFSLLAFLAWIRFSRVPWPAERAQWLHLCVTGLLIHAGYLGGVWSAIKLGMGSGLVALIVGLQPLLTALWVAASHSETRMTTSQWLGLAAGFAGLLLVVWNKLHLGDAVNNRTLSLALFALVSITVGTLYQKRWVKPTDARTANAIQIGVSLLVTAPLTLLESEAVRWTPQLIGALSWSVLALTLGGSSLLYILVQRGAATKVTSLLYLVPPTTAALAWLLFGEPFTWLTLVGMALTAWGVSLVVRENTPASSARTTR